MILINGHQLKQNIFPGGESHVRITPEWITPKTQVIAHLHCAQNIMALIMAVDAIRRISPNCDICLTVPYFPYARQDRVCYPGEALAVKVMADLINQLNCKKVTVFDPHSDVLTALLNCCYVKTQSEIIDESNLLELIDSSSLTLLAPDAGAEKKTRQVCQYLSQKYPSINYITASKYRDVNTGRITQTKVHDSVEGKNLLIIDDICDGGSTFIELAKTLKNAGASQLYLYVTHGIFSKGLKELSQWFEQLYCYNLMNASLKDEAPLTVLS